jgi:hypothetical protein
MQLEAGRLPQLSVLQEQLISANLIRKSKRKTAAEVFQRQLERLLKSRRLDKEYRHKVRIGIAQHKLAMAGFE